LEGYSALFQKLSRKQKLFASLVVFACGLFLFSFGGVCGRMSAHKSAARAANSSHMPDPRAERGIKNVEKLLPLARRLTLESLHALAADYDIKPSEMKVAARHIDGVQTVVLDESLGDRAEVDDARLTEIHVGPDYARDLTTDEETMLLLGHELTHIAASGDNLDAFVEQVAHKAESASGVHPTESQKEDLACDFIGEQTVKRLVQSSAPNEEIAARRIARVFDEDSDESDEGDEEHLSQSATLKALFSLDTELRALLHKSAR